MPFVIIARGNEAKLVLPLAHGEVISHDNRNLNSPPHPNPKFSLGFENNLRIAYCRGKGEEASLKKILSRARVRMFRDLDNFIREVARELMINSRLNSILKEFTIILLSLENLYIIYKHRLLLLYAKYTFGRFTFLLLRLLNISMNIFF